MSERKIDRKELHRLLYKEGKTQAEICRIFGVSKGAVSQAVKDLKMRTTRVLAMAKQDPEPGVQPKPPAPSADATAQEIVRSNINSAEQLNKINKQANKMLDRISAWKDGDPVAIQILESQKRTVRIRGTDEQVTTYHFKDPRELASGLMGEIRDQIDLQVKIYSTLYDMEAFRNFKDAFLESIGKVSPDLRDEIIAMLQKNRLLPTGF